MIPFRLIRHATFLMTPRRRAIESIAGAFLRRSAVAGVRTGTHTQPFQLW